MGDHYTEHLERALEETSKAYAELARKLGLAIDEIKQCQIDLLEAEDKFHVLSFYTKDAQAHECAVSRVQWMAKANDRASKTLKELNPK